MYAARIARDTPLGGDAAEEGLARRRPEACHVAGDDVVLGLEPLRQIHGVGLDDDLAAAQALAGAVVGIAQDPHGDAARDKGPEALPRGSGEVERDGVVRQAVLAPLLGDLVAERRAAGPIYIYRTYIRQTYRNT